MDMCALDEALSRVRARRLLPVPGRRRAIRVRAGLSQRELARVLGVAVWCVKHWEAGRCNPSGARLTEYLAVLDALTAAVERPVVETVPELNDGGA